MRTLSHRFYLYYLVVTATVAAWGAAQLFNWIPKIFSLCLFKSITGLPCPSCGTTRAGLALLNGDPLEAIMINPMGVLTALILGASAFLFVYDILTHKKTLLIIAQKFERTLKRPQVFIPVVTLILLNWSWNFQKGI